MWGQIKGRQIFWKSLRPRSVQGRQSHASCSGSGVRQQKQFLAVGGSKSAKTVCGLTGKIREKRNETVQEDKNQVGENRPLFGMWMGTREKKKTAEIRKIVRNKRILGKVDTYRGPYLGSK